MTITPDIIEQILVEYPHIQSLDFSENLLTGIAELQKTAPTLLALNLQRNRIVFGSDSPNCLGALDNIVVLNLSNNMIDSLRYSQVAQLQKLQELDLSHNRITVLNECTSELAQVEKLRILSLTGNPIFTVLGEESLGLVLRQQLPQLETLDGASLVPTALEQEPAHADIAAEATPQASNIHELYWKDEPQYE